MTRITVKLVPGLYVGTVLLNPKTGDTFVVTEVTEDDAYAETRPAPTQTWIS